MTSLTFYGGAGEIGGREFTTAGKILHPVE